MKVIYDRETELLVITLRDAPVRESDEVRPGGIADFGEDGKDYEYAVQWTQPYSAEELKPDVIQNDIVGDTGGETLTLITCSDDFDPATGQYLRRWVVRATQI